MYAITVKIVKERSLGQRIFQRRIFHGHVNARYCTSSHDDEDSEEAEEEEEEEKEEKEKKEEALKTLDAEISFEKR